MASRAPCVGVGGGICSCFHVSADAVVSHSIHSFASSHSDRCRALLACEIDAQSLIIVAMLAFSKCAQPDSSSRKKCCEDRVCVCAWVYCGQHVSRANLVEAATLPPFLTVGLHQGS